VEMKLRRLGPIRLPLSPRGADDEAESTSGGQSGQDKGSKIEGGNEEEDSPGTVKASRDQGMELTWRHKMEQDPRLPKIRESIADIPEKYRDDDDLLWRIMQCRETIAECDKMLRDLAQWKETYKPELITESEIKPSLAAGSFFICGVDKIGRPIIVVMGSRHEPDKIDHATTIRAMFYWMERAMEIMSLTNVDELVLIYDRSNAGMKNLDFNVIQEWGQIQNYYPLRLGMFYVLHPNMFFTMAYNMASVFLSQRTISKVKLVKHLGDLQDTIDSSNLLDIHGGSVVSPKAGTETDILHDLLEKAKAGKS